MCDKSNVPFEAFDDLLLHPPQDLLKQNGDPYTIFTPFYKNALKHPVPPPKKNLYKNYAPRPIPFAKSHSLFKTILNKRRPLQKGGRKEGLAILNRLPTTSLYEKERDYPAKEGTTHLSPHLKFTTLSPREVYHAMNPSSRSKNALIRSLYWRDFFSSIALHFPHVFKGAFHEAFDHLSWSKSRSLFIRWCEGETGFPIVDAGMRELNKTGFMHNRVRMITASFLVKDLHIHWQKGERYFAQHLIDYDPAVNNGNWQWVAGTGCDASPYFRIFNPWIQQAKFDPDCTYIKQWIPELAHTEVKTIHRWYKEHTPGLYPAPIVDHAKEAAHALSLFKQRL